MSENYQYAECKHCGQSVMENQIHYCRKMILAEIEELKERVEKWKTWHESASEDAKNWRRDAQELQGENNRLKEALKRVATERFPVPTPCRETYLRNIAKAALEI